MARSDILEKLLGKKAADTAVEAVEKIDEVLAEAGVEHKELDAAKMDADAFASAIVDVMKSDLTEDDKRAAVVEAIKDLMPTDHLGDAEKKVHKNADMTDEDMPDDEDEDDEDDEEDAKSKKEFDGIEAVAKMIDNIGTVTEAQLEIESQFKQLEARFGELTALAERVKALEKVVNKSLRERPKMASRADETIVEGDTTKMVEALQDYEIDPIFGKVKRGV